MNQKLDCVEFAVHQLEQSLLTLSLFGGAGTVRHLAELHARIMEDWEESAISSAKAVEAIMEGINVDDNGQKVVKCEHDWGRSLDGGTLICRKCGGCAISLDECR